MLPAESGEDKGLTSRSLRLMSGLNAMYERSGLNVLKPWAFLWPRRMAREPRSSNDCFKAGS